MTNAARIAVTPLHDDHTGDERTQRVAEHLARVGVRIGAQRVELHHRRDDLVEVAAWWGALGHGQDLTDRVGAVPVAWFPWSLGHVRPLESLFVQNAATLAVTPGGVRLGELGYASVLHLPVYDDQRLTGAVCAYWVTERLDWDQGARHQLAEWARAALALLPVAAG